MGAPVLVFYGNSTVSDAGNNNETVAGVSWKLDDWVVVAGLVSTNLAANQLATPTVTGLTGTGLTFALVTSVNNTNANDDVQAFLWTARASGDGSGTIQSVSTANAADRAFIAVEVRRRTRGIGTVATLDASTAKVISLARSRPASSISVALGDWAAINDVAVDATPTGAVRLADNQASLATFFYCTFEDQGATATTSYGITNHTGTVDMSGIAWEWLAGIDLSAKPLDLLLQADWKPQRWDFPLGVDLLLDDFLPSDTPAGALTGATSISFTATAALTGAGGLSGATTLAFSPTATIIGMASISGATTLTFDASGTLAGPGSLSGESTLTFAPSASLTGAGALSGATSLAFTPTSTLTGAGALTGSATITFDVTGTLGEEGPDALSGSSLITFTVVGTLTGTGDLAGSTTLIFSATGNIVDAAAPSGTSGGEYHMQIKRRRRGFAGRR